LFERTAGRTPASALTVGDIAEAVADIMKSERREILEHVGRLFKLLNTKESPAEAIRDRNFHQRLCALESDVRRLAKRGSR
jgi:hypothetical protein